VKRSGAKGGRKSARKAQRLARSKTNGYPSALPSAEIIQTLTLDRQKMILVLRDLLAFYDRATGQSVDHSGYTSADVLRIEEIRKLVES
jgi:hypothetical protein